MFSTEDSFIEKKVEHSLESFFFLHWDLNGEPSSPLQFYFILWKTSFNYSSVKPSNDFFQHQRHWMENTFVKISLSLCYYRNSRYNDTHEWASKAKCSACLAIDVFVWFMSIRFSVCPLSEEKAIEPSWYNFEDMWMISSGIASLSSPVQHQSVRVSSFTARMHISWKPQRCETWGRVCSILNQNHNTKKIRASKQCLGSEDCRSKWLWVKSSSVYTVLLPSWQTEDVGLQSCVAESTCQLSC